MKVLSGAITTASLLVGAKRGLFNKYGFDVEIVPLATGVHASEALASNQVNCREAGHHVDGGAREFRNELVRGRDPDNP